MGLYAIAIRDSRTASGIPAILKEHGYNVRLKSENDRASFYAYPIKRGEMVFSISKGSTGVGREGQELVRILGGEHQRGQSIFCKRLPSPPKKNKGHS